MLSAKVLTRQNVGRLANYYEDGADDYYAKEGDSAEWQGEGALELGLDGAIDSELAKERFRQLLAGEVDPAEPGRRFGRKDSKERIGVDLTFSAPKSVSMQALIAGDPAIIRAHDAAVRSAIDAAEKMAQARQKIDGKTHIEKTEKLVVAKFRHETSREKDPQLHTHAVVMNLTQRADGKWRALKNDEIVKHTRYLGSVYRAELAVELQKAGYELRHGRDGMFELAHISRDQIAAFSQRSAQVEQGLAEKGLTRETASTAQKQATTMQTRSHKTKDDRENIHGAWQQKAKEAGIDFAAREWAGDKSPERLNGFSNESRTLSRDELMAVPAEQAAARAVRYAVNHMTERSAVMNERELVETAANHGMGTVTIKDIESEIRTQREKGFLIAEDPRYLPAERNPGEAPPEPRSRAAWVDELKAKGAPAKDARARVDEAIRAGRLVKDEPRLTTQTALEREKRVLAIERDGRGTLQPIMPAAEVRERLESAGLTKGQQKAVELILTTENSIVGVQGKAGTGKSYMLKNAAELIEKQGYEVRGLAPYGSQVKALQGEGMDARTLASFLKAKDKGIGEKTVLVVDEAGVIPARQMDQLLKLAEKAGARVVLLGDNEQTKAIEAGRPAQQLQANGMQTATMDEIQRQKNPMLREAVEHASEGRTTPSLAKIEVVNVIEDASQRRAKMVDDFVKLAPEDRERTIIVSGTNEARQQINQGIREGLGTVGQGIEYDTLSRRDTTQAERQFSNTYHVGDVIQPEKDYASMGLQRGELYRVNDTGPGNRLTVEHTVTGERVEFSPRNLKSLSVYEPVRAELAPGDRVRITRNDAALDVANGDRFKVAEVTAGAVTLEGANGRRVELATDKPLHVDYAYASTVHSSQGLTTDRVMIEALTRSKTTARDVYYVAISRARHEATIYSDGDRGKLEKAIARENVKSAALDLDRRPNKGREPEARERAGPDPAHQRAQLVGERAAGFAAIEQLRTALTNQRGFAYESQSEGGRPDFTGPDDFTRGKALDKAVTDSLREVVKGPGRAIIERGELAHQPEIVAIVLAARGRQRGERTAGPDRGDQRQRDAGKERPAGPDRAAERQATAGRAEQGRERPAGPDRTAERQATAGKTNPGREAPSAQRPATTPYWKSPEFRGKPAEKQGGRTAEPKTIEKAAQQAKAPRAPEKGAKGRTAEPKGYERG